VTCLRNGAKRQLFSKVLAQPVDKGISGGLFVSLGANERGTISLTVQNQRNPKAKPGLPAYGFHGQLDGA
jgi:hypothetical protein